MGGQDARSLPSLATPLNPSLVFMYILSMLSISKNESGTILRLVLLNGNHRNLCLSLHPCSAALVVVMLYCIDLPFPFR
jgi:hypothetical protein